jgi:hypothetical protein
VIPGRMAHRMLLETRGRFTTPNLNLDRTSESFRNPTQGPLVSSARRAGSYPGCHGTKIGTPCPILHAKQDQMYPLRDPRRSLAAAASEIVYGLCIGVPYWGSYLRSPTRVQISYSVSCQIGQLCPIGFSYGTQIHRGQAPHCTRDQEALPGTPVAVAWHSMAGATQPAPPRSWPARRWRRRPQTGAPGPARAGPGAGSCTFGSQQGGGCSVFGSVFDRNERR